MSSDPIESLIRAREAGHLSRDGYWEELQKRHMALIEYAALIDRSEAESLEVTANGVILKVKDGTRFHWDPSDFRSPPVVVINEGGYEATEWAVLRALSSDRKAVLDVGANIGWYAIRLAAIADATVYAFEPVPSTFGILTANIALNDISDRVCAYPFGVSDRPRHVRFFIPGKTGSVAASEQLLFDGEPQTEVEVELRTIDEVVASEAIGPVGLIKCDVEGGELGVLRGAPRVLDTDRPFVLVEMLRKWAVRFGYHPNDIIAWMSSFGYRCASIEEGRLRSIPEIDDMTEATNFLFFHETQVADASRILSQAIPDVRLD
jgi:FkbM family methyltransferase